MESLTENKALLYSIIGSAGAILALAMGIFPEMAYQFEIVDFPAEVSAIFSCLLYYYSLDCIIHFKYNDLLQEIH